MKAAWYQRQGSPPEVLEIGEMATPAIPFWPLVFKNIRIHFLGSDEFPVAARTAAASALNDALESEWPGFEIGMRFPLESIAKAHEAGGVAGRVVVTL